MLEVRARSDQVRHHSKHRPQLIDRAEWHFKKVRSGRRCGVFGDRLEAGRDVDQSQLNSFQRVLNRFLGTQRR
jgi:hypothetical protein